jgi:flagellar biosynthesis/type III secretory pathway M-ring protein FliF/YscJ
MTGYIILAAFVFFVIACFAAFMAGLKQGRKAAEAEYAEERARKEKDRRDYEKAAQEIKQEVFHDAAQEKAELASHAGAGDRFNAVNNSLRNRPKN